MLFAALNHHLMQHNTHTSYNIRCNLCVDNAVTGYNTEQDVLQAQSRAKFNLRAWASNSKLPVERSEQDGTIDSSNPINILRIHYNTLTDRLSLSLKGLCHIDNQACGVEGCLIP